MGALRPSGVPIFVTYLIFNLLSLLAVILRFLALRIRKRPVKHHDYLCVLSLVALFAYSSDTFIGVIDGGIGQHITMLSLSELVIALKTFWVSEFFWATSICAFRISMLLLYLEIFVQKGLKIAAYICIGLVSLFWLGSITTTLRLCQPIAKTWNPALPGTCGDVVTAELAAASINFVLDIVIVCLPLPVVWDLHMPVQRKLGVSAVLALGLSIAGVNLTRIILAKTCNQMDFTYCTGTAAILTVAEMALGVIVSCTPLLGPVLFPRKFGPSAQAVVYKPSVTPGTGPDSESHRMKSAPKHSYHRFDSDEALRTTDSTDF